MKILNLASGCSFRAAAKNVAKKQNSAPGIQNPHLRDNKNLKNSQKTKK